MKQRHGRTIAATLLVLLIAAGMLFVATQTKAEPSDTYHSGWKLIRETAMEDGADFAAVYPLATNKGNYASKDSSTVALGGPYQIRSYIGSGRGTEFQSVGSMWAFTICGGAANDDTFSFTILAWARTNGMAQVIAHGDGVIGTQDVAFYPDDGATAAVWWADTLNLDDTDRWRNVNTYNNGNNEVAELVIDLAGIEWIQFIIYDADDEVVGEADPITVYGRPYG